MRDFRLVQLAIVVVFVLVLGRVPAHAAFIIEFADGQKMTVSNYQEVGPYIKVFTLNGSFAFRKEDIIQIVGTEQKPAAPRPTTDAPLPSARHEEPRQALPAAVTRKTATHDALPALPSWDGLFGLAMEGVYRGRFFIGFFVGVKVLQFFLPATFH